MNKENRRMAFRFTIFITIMVALSFSLAGCSKAQAFWAYQLQADPFYPLDRMSRSKVGTIVMDYSHDGSEAGELSEDEVALVKGDGEFRPIKRILSYMSIGEAEENRFYWDNSWTQNGTITSASPQFLFAVNPEWPDNYKVRYWDPEWRAVVDQYLDRIVSAGFSGVYLDIVDAYYYFGPFGEGKHFGTERESADHMIDLILIFEDLSCYVV